MADPATSTVGPTDTADTAAWLRRVAALTVVPSAGWPEDEVAAATAAAAALSASAAALLAAGAVPASCTVPCADCAVDCGLVRDLAAVALPHAATVVADPAAFDALLAAAAGAVFTCRRTLHTASTCLFGAGDLCGRVLAAAHRLG
jgi:hypothetical protein